MRSLLVALLASALAAWVGVALAQERYLLASLAAGVSVWAVLSWIRGPLAEAWLLAFLFFGYVIGSRGFAQVMPLSGLPLFLSELGLGIALALVILRGALRRKPPVRRDSLNALLLLWLALGAGRIVWDIRTYGFLALRDFALVYYVLYFFVAQALADHEPSRRLLRTAAAVTLAVLPLGGLLAYLFPDFFLTNFLVEGVPLIYYKGDLLATFLFAGYIILLPAGALDLRRDGWRVLAAIVSLVLGFLLLSRASLVGLVVAMGWLAWAGNWRPVRFLAGMCVAALLAVFAYSLLQKKDFGQTKAYAIYEMVMSIADLSGTRAYASEMSGNKGDNNRFRLVWWRNVVLETAAVSPVFGQGFGADLAHGFLLEYYPVGEADFAARSPHNVFLTTFGRMGAIGVVVLLAIYATVARNTLRAAREARQRPERIDVLALQAACWVVMISACFGVVLEGPMGAIPFWILLGLAHHAATRPEP